MREDGLALDRGGVRARAGSVLRRGEPLSEGVRDHLLQPVAAHDGPVGDIVLGLWAARCFIVVVRGRGRRDRSGCGDLRDWTLPGRHRRGGRQ